MTYLKLQQKHSSGSKVDVQTKQLGRFITARVGPMARLRMKLLHATWLFPSEGLRMGPITKQQVAHH